MDCVPAQLDAAVYLDKVAAEYQGPIIVSGHSKGGNLAVYAAAYGCRESCIWLYINGGKQND